MTPVMSQHYRERELLQMLLPPETVSFWGQTWRILGNILLKKMVISYYGKKQVFFFLWGSQQVLILYLGYLLLSCLPGNLPYPGLSLGHFEQLPLNFIFLFRQSSFKNLPTLRMCFHRTARELSLTHHILRPTKEQVLSTR